jgi:hypothetical protein
VKIAHLVGIEIPLLQLSAFYQKKYFAPRIQNLTPKSRKYDMVMTNFVRFKVSV